MEEVMNIVKDLWKPVVVAVIGIAAGKTYEVLSDKRKIDKAAEALNAAIDEAVDEVVAEAAKEDAKVEKVEAEVVEEPKQVNPTDAAIAAVQDAANKAIENIKTINNDNNVAKPVTFSTVQG